GTRVSPISWAQEAVIPGPAAHSRLARYGRLIVPTQSRREIAITRGSGTTSYSKTPSERTATPPAITAPRAGHVGEGLSVPPSEASGRSATSKGDIATEPEDGSSNPTWRRRRWSGRRFRMMICNRTDDGPAGPSARTSTWRSWSKAAVRTSPLTSEEAGFFGGASSVGQNEYRS